MHPVEEDPSRYLLRDRQEEVDCESRHYRFVRNRNVCVLAVSDMIFDPFLGKANAVGFSLPRKSAQSGKSEKSDKPRVSRITSGRSMSWRIVNLIHAAAVDNGYDHRAGTRSLIFKNTRKSGFVCIVLLSGD